MGAKPSPYTFAAGTCAFRSRVKHTLLLGWNVADPSRVELVLGTPRGAAVGGGRWHVPRQLLSAGMAGWVQDGGACVWPAGRGRIDWTMVRPAVKAEPFAIAGSQLVKFLAKTDFWVPIGGEVPFEVGVGRLLGRAA